MPVMRNFADNSVETNFIEIKPISTHLCHTNLQNAISNRPDTTTICARVSPRVIAWHLSMYPANDRLCCNFHVTQ